MRPEVMGLAKRRRDWGLGKAKAGLGKQRRESES